MLLSFQKFEKLPIWQGYLTHCWVSHCFVLDESHSELDFFPSWRCIIGRSLCYLSNNENLAQLRNYPMIAVWTFSVVCSTNFCALAFHKDDSVLFWNQDLWCNFFAWIRSFTSLLHQGLTFLSFSLHWVFYVSFLCPLCEFMELVETLYALGFLLTGPPALLYLLCKKYQFFLSVYTLLMFPDINHRPSGCNQLTVLHLIHERTALNRVSLLKRSHHQWVTFHPTNVYNRGTRANLCIGRRFLEKKHSALLQHNCNRSVRFLIRQHHRVGQSHPLMLIKLWARQL